MVGVGGTSGRSVSLSLSLGQVNSKTAAVIRESGILPNMEPRTRKAKLSELMRAAREGKQAAAEDQPAVVFHPLEPTA